jgi:ubiquinone/menaquinone biosynthesis C-methylase UbiE|tara:strand:+ start:113 stop:856 length:744 start_codon:yes stop_codon:yes gene_type:complete
MADSWDFSGSAEWYDVILGKNEYEKNAKFVSQQLQKFNVKTVLELACGSGLYLFPLKKNGFNVEGLDISKEMLDVARKRSKAIKLYQQDMTKFNTKKKNDAILILNSGLALLPNHSLIDKTIKRCQENLDENGILLIDLPNHKKEIKESNFTQSHEEYKIPNGKIDVIFRDYKKNDKWIAEWYGFVKQGNKFSQFKEYYEELIYSPQAIEKSLKNHGFRILKVFGSRKGGKFNPDNSWRRFYLCQKR